MTALYVTLLSLAGTMKDRLSKEDRGATAVEYGLLVGLIAAVIITVVALLSFAAVELEKSVRRVVMRRRVGREQE